MSKPERIARNVFEIACFIMPLAPFKLQLINQCRGLSAKAYPFHINKLADSTVRTTSQTFLLQQLRDFAGAVLRSSLEDCLSGCRNSRVKIANGRL